MMTEPNIIILAGGVGAERDISLLSGRALFESLSPHFTTKLIDLTKRSCHQESVQTVISSFLLSTGNLVRMENCRHFWTLKVSNTVEAVRMQVVYVCTNLRPKKERPGMEFECRAG